MDQEQNGIPAPTQNPQSPEQINPTQPASVPPPPPSAQNVPTYSPEVPPQQNPNIAPSIPKKKSFKKPIIIVLIVVVVIVVAIFASLVFANLGKRSGGTKAANEFVALLEAGESKELDDAIYNSSIWTLKYGCAKESQSDSENSGLCEFINEADSETSKSYGLAGAKIAIKLDTILEALKTTDAKKYQSTFGTNKYGDEAGKVYYSFNTSSGEKYLSVSVVKSDLEGDGWHLSNIVLTDTKPAEK